MRAVVVLAIFAAAEAIRPNDGKKIAPVTLLHQGVSSTGEVNSHARAGEPVWERGTPANPGWVGHMLTDHELAPVTNIACLQAKEVDPTVNCSTRAPRGLESEAMPAPNIALNAGNYPTWKDPRCYSSGEYFCDPDRLLSTKQRTQLAAQMKKLREGQKITCGPQLQHDPVDKWHYEPFYLGVAIAKDWPQHESDAQSLQSFGRMLAGRWNMSYAWDGNPAFYARCPNEAMLIILPEKRQAVLSSPSCMFLCQSKGGPEVATATILGLDSAGGLEAGVSAGMAEVYKAIAQSSPMHKSGWEPVEKTAGTYEAWNKAPAAPVAIAPQVTLEASFWDWSQRILFGVAIVMLAASIVVALLVCYLAPGAYKELNKSVV